MTKYIKTGKHTRLNISVTICTSKILIFKVSIARNPVLKLRQGLTTSQRMTFKGSQTYEKNTQPLYNLEKDEYK